MGRKKPFHYKRNRTSYLAARRVGWKPLAETRLLPWETRLLSKSLRAVLETGIGSARSPQQTADILKRIIPLAAKEIVGAMGEQISVEDRRILNQLLSWRARNPGITPTAKIIALGKELGETTLRKVNHVVALSRSSTFKIEHEERWYRKSKTTFQENLDFQLKHDIQGALFEIQNFLRQFEFPKEH